METLCSVSVLGRQAARMFSGQFDETLALQSLQARSASEGAPSAASSAQVPPASAATQACIQPAAVKGSYGPALPTSMHATKALVSLQPADQQEQYTSEETIALAQKALEKGASSFLRPQLAELSKPQQHAPPGLSSFLLLSPSSCTFPPLNLVLGGICASCAYMQQVGSKIQAVIQLEGVPCSLCSVLHKEQGTARWHLVSPDPTAPGRLDLPAAGSSVVHAARP